MTPVADNCIEQDGRSYFDLFWKHVCFYLLVAAIFLFLCGIRPTSRVDSVDYAAVGSHLYYNHNWLPTGDGGYSKYANEGYEFLHCFATFFMGNAPISRGSAISFVAFMLGSFFYVQCLRHFFSLRESQLILLLQIPLLDIVVLPLTDSVAWCFFVALMWVFIKKEFRASFVFGLILGAGILCRNHILIIFLPLPVLMGTLPAWKKDWKTLSWDLCRCAAGVAVSLVIFEILVFFWVENFATSGNFYSDYHAKQAVGVQGRLLLFLKYCKHFIYSGFDAYGGILITVFLSIVFCPVRKFAWRFAWFVLFSSAATFLSYALLAYARDEGTPGRFQVRYLIYYYSALFPYWYYFASIIARRIQRRNLVPLPRIISASRFLGVAVTIALVVSFAQLLSVPLYKNACRIGRDISKCTKCPQGVLGSSVLYRNELALSDNLCDMPSSQPTLCVFFGEARTEWYQALYPVPSYETDTLITYRGASREKRNEAAENFFGDHDLSKYSRIVLMVDKIYLDGLWNKADKPIFEKLLCDERLSKEFDRKEFDCKMCMIYVFTAKKQ